MSLNRRAFTLGASATALAACQPSGPAPSGADFVNLYTARHYDADRALYAAFEQATGVRVRALQARGEQLLQRLEAEGEATEADVVVAADAGNLWRVQDARLLQPIITPTLQQNVPERLRDVEGHWWGFSKRARVIVYRKDVVDPATLTSMDVLAEPRFRGQVLAQSSQAVYNLSLLSSRIERLGAENARTWAAGVRANFAREPQGSDTDQIRAIAAGEAQVAISNHYYLVRLMKSEAPEDRAVVERVGLVWPDQGAGPGVHVNISGGGVARHAKRLDRATQFLEFLVSDEAQLMLAPLNTEYPIRPAIEPSPELQALGTFKEESIPLSALGRHQAEATAIYEAAGWR